MFDDLRIHSEVEQMTVDPTTWPTLGNLAVRRLANDVVEKDVGLSVNVRRDMT